MSFFKKYKKDLQWVGAAAVTGLLPILGDGISDYAKTPFWWTFWEVAGWVGAAVWVAGWFFFRNRDRNR